MSICVPLQKGSFPTWLLSFNLQHRGSNIGATPLFHSLIFSVLLKCWAFHPIFTVVDTFLIIFLLSFIDP